MCTFAHQYQIMQPSILLTTLNAKYIHLNLAIRILYDLNHHRGNIFWKEKIKKKIARNLSIK